MRGWILVINFTTVGLDLKFSELTGFSKDFEGRCTLFEYLPTDMGL